MRSKRGSNQHKARRTLHLWGQREGTGRELTYYLLGVAFLVSLFGTVRNVHLHWEKAAHSAMLVKPVYAADYVMPDLAPLPERAANIALIKKVWGNDAVVGLAISRCESGYRTMAKHDNDNGTQDQGIFQVNTVHQMPDMFNPTANALYAYSIYREQGTTPWNSSKSCWGGEIE